jgi:hypothetical protein
VFVELAHELEAQGISRKVSADMFGMALRAYIRKLRRLGEGKTDQGKTLWQAVLEFIREQPMVSRPRVFERFRCDGDLEVSAIVHDLLDSGLIFSSGTGQQAVFRAANDQELSQLSKIYSTQGFDDLVWVTVFRSGPLTDEDLGALLGRPAANLQDAIDRLMQLGHVERLPSGVLRAQDFLIPLGATVGFEAAVFDHIQAVVQTICQRLEHDAEHPRDWVGGSTYTFDVWPGHPLENAVKSQLNELRQRCGDLRSQVTAYNAQHGLDPHYEQITTYVGQCGIARQLDDNGGARSENEQS